MKISRQCFHKTTTLNLELDFATLSIAYKEVETESPYISSLKSDPEWSKSL